MKKLILYITATILLFSCKEELVIEDSVECLEYKHDGCKVEIVDLAWSDIIAVIDTNKGVYLYEHREGNLPKLVWSSKNNN